MIKSFVHINRANMLRIMLLTADISGMMKPKSVCSAVLTLASLSTIISKVLSKRGARCAASS